MKVFSKIALPVSLSVVVAVLSVSFFFDWYLERQLFNEMYLERKDDVLRTSNVLLGKDIFLDPMSEKSQNTFKRFIDNLRAGDVIRATVWDTDGNVLISDLASMTGKQAIQHNELFTVYATKRSVFLEKKYDNNIPLQTSVSPLRVALIPLMVEGNFVGVVELHMTNQMIGKTINRSAYSIAGLLTATGILLVLAMIFVVRRVIVEPIQRITSASEKLSRGEFDTVIETQTKDEIGALAKVFIQMKTHLKKNISELEQKKLVAENANRKVTAEKVRAEGILRYLRSIGEGVYATDRKGTIVFCNVTAAQLTNKAPEDLIGENSSQYFKFCIGTEDNNCDFEPFKEAIESKQSRAFAAKTFLVGKEKTIPVSGTFSPIVEVDHISGSIVVFQDITERYELEQMKDRFLSIAAHQLRTPLGSMKWSMELLEAGDLGKLPKGALDAVIELQKNSNRMMTLVDNLLNVSRIDQGNTDEKPEAVDLGVLASEAIKAVEGEAKKRGIACKLTMPQEKIPKITLIRDHIFEAIENLVSNAIRYGREKGEVEISFEIEKEHLILSVKDNGIGIPKADQSKLFAKFFRASNAAKAFTDGSGLGLSVVKSYVEEANATIWLESEENVGTKFFVKFPLKPSKKLKTS